MLFVYLLHFLYKYNDCNINEYVFDQSKWYLIKMNMNITLYYDSILNDIPMNEHEKRRKLLLLFFFSG